MQIGIKVRHLSWGDGIVRNIYESNDGREIKVEFSNRTVVFQYPGAFEEVVFANGKRWRPDLWAVDEAIQEEIEEDIRNAKVAAERVAIETGRRLLAEERRRDAVRERFEGLRYGDDYHVEHLDYSHVMTYQDVEYKFDVRLYPYALNIYETKRAIVLLSFISDNYGDAVYRDRLTTNGEYIFSGVGIRGDQTMTGSNLAIKNARDDKKDIRLIVSRSSMECLDQGICELTGITYEYEKDILGNVRKVYKFRLKRKGKWM